MDHLTLQKKIETEGITPENQQQLEILMKSELASLKESDPEAYISLLSKFNEALKEFNGALKSTLAS